MNGLAAMWKLMTAAMLAIAFQSPVRIPSAPEKYELLVGERLSGSAFVIEWNHELWAVMSQHQFGGRTPSTVSALLKAAPIPLKTGRVVKQRDVQAMPLQDERADLQFLRYDPEFTIAAGEPLTILGPAGDVVTAAAPGIQMEGGKYSCAEGVREFRAQASTAFRAAGGSGGPVLKASTGTVVGVLLTADDPSAARVVGFETLCLGRAAK